MSVELHADNWFSNINGRKCGASGFQKNKLQRDAVGQVLPRQGAIASTWLQTSSQNEILFDLNHDIDVVDNIYLQWTLTNNHASATATLVDGFSQIDTINIYCENQLVQALYGVELRNLFCLSVTPTRGASLYSAVGISSSAFTSTVSMANGASQTLTVPILSILDKEIPHWRDMRWQVGVIFRGGANLMLSGNTPAITDITFTNLKLYVDGNMLKPDVKAGYDAQLSQGPITYRYSNMVREIIPAGAMTSGSPYAVNFKTTGKVSSLLIFPHEVSAANQSAVYAPSQQLTSFEFLVDSQPIDSKLPDNSYTSSLRKIFDTDLYQNTIYTTALNHHQINFSEDPLNSALDGGMAGGLLCQGRSEQIRIVPSSNYTSVQLDCYSQVFSLITIDYASKRVNVLRNYM